MPCYFFPSWKNKVGVSGANYSRLQLKGFFLSAIHKHAYRRRPETFFSSLPLNRLQQFNINHEQTGRGDKNKIVLLVYQNIKEYIDGFYSNYKSILILILIIIPILLLLIIIKSWRKCKTMSCTASCHHLK